jgi:hypothetical protein
MLKIAEVIWSLYVNSIYLKGIHSHSYIFLLLYIQRISSTSITDFRMTHADVINRLSHKPHFQQFPFNKYIRHRYFYYFNRA